jgi:hypothetical protein
VSNMNIHIGVGFNYRSFKFCCKLCKNVCGFGSIHVYLGNSNNLCYIVITFTGSMKHSDP